jgi:predicted phosphodiesterase
VQSKGCNGKMKIGIISDIHNNLVALNRVLKYFRESNCEKIICCGDIVSIGPLPEETVRRIMGIENLICVRGNHEDYLKKIGSGESLVTEMHENEALYHMWEFERLSDECKHFLDLLPVFRFEIINEVKIYVIHYPMDGNNYMSAIRDLTLQMCEQMFSDINADIILFGHSHKYFNYENSNTRFINVPSLGCPSRSKNIAHAGILEVIDKKSVYNTISLEYNVTSVISQINSLNYPACDEIKQIFYGLQ